MDLESDHDLTTILTRNREWIAENLEEDPDYFGKPLLESLSGPNMCRESRRSPEASLPLLRMLRQPSACQLHHGS